MTTVRPEQPLPASHSPLESLSRRNVLRASSALTTGAIIGAGAPASHRASAQTPSPHPQAVVSAHALATDAGMEMLGLGGTAADAAVAVAAVLSVVEGWFSNVLGGEIWGLYYDAGAGELTSLDAVGPVGANVDVDAYEAIADQPGAHQSILPGAWDGWMLWLDRYGALDLGAVLSPAIRIAREGFPASALMIDWLRRLEDDVRASPESARTYVIDGELPSTGDTITIPDLAATFERLAESFATSTGPTRSDAIQAARDYYYRGPLAEEVVAWSDANGGFLSIEDFAAYEAQLVPPISIDYTDEITVFQCPPNSQGITMLLGLNILKGVDFTGQNIESPDVVHAQVEALKLAFADRYAFVGDPERVQIPLEELLSDAYADAQRSRIDMQQAMSWPIASGLPRPGASNTSTFHIIDGQGNIAGATTSIGAQFMIAGDTGIHMNARLSFCSLEPQEPNYLTPGYN
ncbi:MAG: gamma-glutamyltransferase family protein, partial [Thermomicrobiales bacterium]